MSAGCVSLPIIFRVDVYFKTHREGHNLDRCRTQFKLVEDMEKKWQTMQEIVRS